MPSSSLDSLTINAPSSQYPIYFGNDFLSSLDAYIAPYCKGHKVFIVSDKTVGDLYLRHVEEACSRLGKKVVSFVLEPGEGSKSFKTFEVVSTDMLASGPDRNTTLIALGGGVIGDLTGYIASVLLRGVPFIQIPTTLLAQVDSSVGGKTAINCKAGKNLIGTFYQPNAVFMDLLTLDSLPKRELLAGYAEIIKYGLLGDKQFYEMLLSHGQEIINGNKELQRQCIKFCCKMKADIVAEDEKEKGVRALLNLGHTFGHAIEKQAAYDGTVLHGEAVALGCLMALSLAIKRGDLAQNEQERLLHHFKTIGMPTHLSDFSCNHDWDASTLAGYCYQDKKAEQGGLTFITLDAIGKAAISKDITREDVIAIFQEYC